MLGMEVMEGLNTVTDARFEVTGAGKKENVDDQTVDPNNEGGIIGINSLV